MTEFCIKEAIRSLRFGECDTIADAAEVYGLPQAWVRKEASLCGLTFKERGDDGRNENRKRNPGGMRFTKEQEKDLVQQIVTEWFEATTAEILALANTKLGEDEQVSKSWVTGFLNRNPEAREAIDKCKKRLEQNKPKPKSTSSRPNAANRKFTELQEEELEDRILDSNCNCYADMKIIAEELLEEIGRGYETITDHWMYAFVKRYPLCKEVITEKSGGWYIIPAGSTFTRSVYTYNDHPNMRRLEEAKGIWWQVYLTAYMADRSMTYSDCEYPSSLVDTYIEIGKRVLDKRYEDDVIHGFIEKPVRRDGREVQIPILPADPNEMMSLLRRVKKDLEKERQEPQGSETGVQVKAEPEAAERAEHETTEEMEAATAFEEPSIELTTSPLKTADPNKKVGPPKGKGSKKRARQEDKENETPLLVDGNKAKDAGAEKIVEQPEATQAPKRRKQAKAKTAPLAEKTNSASQKPDTTPKKTKSTAKKTTPPAVKTASLAKKAAVPAKKTAPVVEQAAPRRSARSTKGVKK